MIFEPRRARTPGHPAALRLAGVLLLALGSALASCYRSPSDPLGKEREVAQIPASAPAVQDSMPQGYLPRMITAPFTVAYRGQREIEFHYDVDGVPLALVFQEDVGADGEGKFALEFLNFKQGAAANEELYRLMHAYRASFSYRFRDFRIRDLRRFNRNYRVSLIAEQVDIAGLECVELRVERKDYAEFYHEVCVHIETGLLLRWKQRTTSGDSLISRMEFKTIALGGSAEDMDLIDGRFQWERLETNEDFSVAAGFKTLNPVLIPDGFDLGEAYCGDQLPDTEVGARTWMRFIYDDGLEPLVFMVGGPAEAANVEPDHIVEGFRIGPWHTFKGELHGYPVILMGQRTRGELLMVLESAQPAY